MVFTSTVFALLHLSHGPDFIPLFFLSLGLGYLYQKTQRLVPCLVVHALLNGTTMVILVLNLLEKGAAVP
jgi:membrane protease YdiL (CAAX protease family)